jgi:hypothetical protein
LNHRPTVLYRPVKYGSARLAQNSKPVSVIFLQKLVIEYQSGFAETKLERSIRCLQANLQETILGTRKVTRPNVWEPEPKARFILLASKESNGSAKSPNYTITESEMLGLGSIHDVYMEVSEAIVSVKIAPLERHLSIKALRSNTRAISHASAV